MVSPLRTLTDINLDDLVASFGWQKQPLLAAMLRALFFRPARKFAQQMVEYDDLVGQVGLHEASCRILARRYVHDLRVHGRELVPASGPILILANHPGMADTISLFAAINRPDLRIIAMHRPFLSSLVNITKQLSYISDDPGERMRAVRQVSAHLRAGGAALTFPAGQIEPDPAVHPDALESLCTWTDSSAIFLRFAPETRIIPVLVSGVLWEKTARHWLTRFKQTREDRERLAAALQLLVIILGDARPTTVHVHIGRPITAEEAGSADMEDIHRKLMERMRGLIEERGKTEGESIL
jgi:1-acyl-sn-glycerol-3-phosphate acyltransferase